MHIFRLRIDVSLLHFDTCGMFFELQLLEHFLPDVMMNSDSQEIPLVLFQIFVYSLNLTKGRVGKTFKKIFHIFAMKCLMKNQ